MRGADSSVRSNIVKTMIFKQPFKARHVMLNFVVGDTGRLMTTLTGDPQSTFGCMSKTKFEFLIYPLSKVLLGDTPFDDCSDSLKMFSTEPKSVTG
jgi:hypothetical protein